MIRRSALLALVRALALALAGSVAAESIAEEGLKPVRFSELSNQRLNPLATTALAVRPDEWKHAETENFILHYLDEAAAKQVAVEAEFFYRAIAKDLGKEGPRSERKARILVCDAGVWEVVRRTLELDRMTGGAHLDNELALPRDGNRFQGPVLGHEITHLVLDRFYGRSVPLWLNEGYAEYVSRVLYASFYRARKFAARPHLPSLRPEDFIPLERLTGIRSYPANERELIAFYVESCRLTAFLAAQGKEEFRVFLEAIARGSFFESAVGDAFGGRFSTRSDLEDKFRTEIFKAQPD